MHVRRLLALLCLAAIVALRVEPQLLRFPFAERATLSRWLTRFPDRLWPQYARFLEGVRAQTSNGDSIALVVPGMKWDEGYAYAYYRASYFLSGREVLPLVDPGDRLHPENFRAAKYIAAWRSNLPEGRHTIIWRGEGGVLMRRQ
jgi:hypothetical protein